jgi:hypothetical protein
VQTSHSSSLRKSNRYVPRRDSRARALHVLERSLSRVTEPGLRRRLEDAIKNMKAAR